MSPNIGDIEGQSCSGSLSKTKVFSCAPAAVISLSVSPQQAAMSDIVSSALFGVSDEIGIERSSSGEPFLHRVIVDSPRVPMCFETKVSPSSSLVGWLL